MRTESRALKRSRTTARSMVYAVLGSPNAPTGDWLLVHATPTYTTLTVMRDHDLLFHRWRRLCRAARKHREKRRSQENFHAHEVITQSLNARASACARGPP